MIKFSWVPYTDFDVDGGWCQPKGAFSDVKSIGRSHFFGPCKGSDLINTNSNAQAVIASMYHS